jgi:hypothetical protein
MLPALSLEGILYIQIVHGSFNSTTFTIFLEGLPQCMNPYPGPKSVLAMDNCMIHHVKGVQEMCDEQCVVLSSCLAQLLLIFCGGVKLMYLPPYLPNFNPIEECFLFMKAYICQHGFCFRSEIEMGHKDRPYLFLYEALNTVKAHNAWGWFHHSKYV